MRHMNCIKAACAALLLTAASAASAANLVVQDGKLTGATGVNVGGTLYDVQFVEGTCVSLFNGCDEASDFDFTDEMSATTALQALLDQVFVDGPSGNFDTDPSLTFGCVSMITCLTIVPYAFKTSSDAFVIFATNLFTENNDTVSGVTSAFRNSNTSTVDSINYAKFSLSPVAAVPEPNTWALMILGFGLVGAATRRRTAATRVHARA